VFIAAKRQLWYLDSDCSRHMTGDKSKFVSLKAKEEGFVTYEENNQGMAKTLLIKHKPWKCLNTTY